MSRNLDKKKCCYPRYLHVPSPSRIYHGIRLLFLIACVLTCLISPDLTMGILLFLFIFSNFANIWNFQVWYSAIVSIVKIGVSLLFSVLNIQDTSYFRKILIMIYLSCLDCEEDILLRL